MEKIKKLTKLVYKEAVSLSPDFYCSYNELNVILTCIGEIEFERKNPGEWYRDNTCESHRPEGRCF